MNCFNFAENFLRFVTEAHVVYLALLLCDMDDVEAVPQLVDKLQSHDDLLSFFRDLCERVVRHIWLNPSITDITSIVDCPIDNSFVADSWCICGEGTPILLQIQCSKYYYGLNEVFVAS